jgi:hypothetical protein
VGVYLLKETVLLQEAAGLYVLKEPIVNPIEKVVGLYLLKKAKVKF